MTIKTDEFRTTLIENLVSPEELVTQRALVTETTFFRSKIERTSLI